jgi:hypothetical protein
MRRGHDAGAILATRLIFLLFHFSLDAASTFMGATEEAHQGAIVVATR